MQHDAENDFTLSSTSSRNTSINKIHLWRVLGKFVDCCYSFYITKLTWNKFSCPFGKFQPAHLVKFSYFCAYYFAFIFFKRKVRIAVHRGTFKEIRYVIRLNKSRVYQINACPGHFVRPWMIYILIWTCSTTHLSIFWCLSVSRYILKRLSLAMPWSYSTD